MYIIKTKQATIATKHGKQVDMEGSVRHCVKGKRLYYGLSRYRRTIKHDTTHSPLNSKINFCQTRVSRKTPIRRHDGRAMGVSHELLGDRDISGTHCISLIRMMQCYNIIIPIDRKSQHLTLQQKPYLYCSSRRLTYRLRVLILYS